MKRYTAIFLSVALMAVGLTALPASADNNEQSMTIDERMDLREEAMEDPNDFEVVDENALEAFEATIHDDLGLLAPQPLDSTAGNDAGCAAAEAGASNWAVAGTPEGPCDGEVHEFGITHTVIDCTEACSADAFNLPTFEFIVLSCEEGSTAIVDWENGQIFAIEGECAASGSPLEYTEWDSLGTDKWSHTDNPVDALLHLAA